MFKMFHSDRGGEFTSKPGCSYDNAISENIFFKLKGEGIDEYYKDVNKLVRDVNKWVKWYNNVRMHSGLQSKAPKQVRAELEAI